MTFPWLTILGIIPLIGAAFMLFPVRNSPRVRGLIVSFVTAGCRPRDRRAVRARATTFLGRPLDPRVRRLVGAGASMAWASRWCS